MNIAAVVRGHTAEAARARALAAELAAAHGRVVLACDETFGPFDAGPFEKRPHTLARLAALGLKIPQPESRALWYLGDYAFYGSLIDDAEFDFYMMVEYDVGLRHPGDGTWSELFAALRGGALDGVDMVGVNLGPYRNTHFRHTFAAPWKGLFAIVGLSRRALEHLFPARLAEQAAPHPDPRGAMSEVFVPSTLTRDGFRVVDLNDILPGSYDGRGVNARDIFPIGFEHFSRTRGKLLHRVAEVDGFLAKGPGLAARHGWAGLFANQLDRLAQAGIAADRIEAAREDLGRAVRGDAVRRARGAPGARA